MNLNLGNGAKRTIKLAKIIHITQLERIPTTGPSKYESIAVAPKKATKATILVTLVFFERVSVILVLANSTLSAAANKLQIEQKERNIARVYIRTPQYFGVVLQ